MKAFCTNCGAEIKPNQSHCVECGQAVASKAEQPPVQPTAPTPEPKAQQSAPDSQQPPKQPMSKKNKIIYAIIGAVVLLLIAAYSVGKSYYAPEKVLERFNTAVKDEDVKAVQNHVEFTNGEGISKVSAQAIINFAAEEPDDFQYFMDSNSPEGLYTLKAVGKKLGLFEDYKIVTAPVTLSVNLPFEELTYSLNGEELDGKIENDRKVYKPLASGFYEIEAKYDGEYTSFTNTEMQEVIGVHDAQVDVDLQYDVRFVKFELMGTDNLSMDDMKLKVGKKEIDFDRNGIVEKAGPFLLDGSQTVTVTNKLPWGEAVTAEIPVTADYIDLPLPALNEEVEKTLTKMIPAHFEQMVEARAKLDEKVLKHVTESYRVSNGDQFERHASWNEFYSGKLLEVQMSFEDARYKREDGKDRIFMPTWVLTDERVDKDGSSDGLDRKISSCNIVLDYVKDEWLVNDCENRYSTDELNGVTVEGSKKLHKAAKSKDEKSSDDKEEKDDKSKKEDKKSKKDEKSSSKDDEKFSSSELESFVSDYNKASVEAINDRDFSIVKDKIQSGAPREKEQSDYLDYLAGRGITEDHLSTTYESSKKIDDTTVQVTTVEEFNIHYEDKPTKKSKFRTVNQLKYVDGEWKLHKLIDTKEIK